MHPLLAELHSIEEAPNASTPATPAIQLAGPSRAGTQITVTAQIHREASSPPHTTHTTQGYTLPTDNLQHMPDHRTWATLQTVVEEDLIELDPDLTPLDPDELTPYQSEPETNLCHTQPSGSQEYPVNIQIPHQVAAHREEGSRARVETQGYIQNTTVTDMGLTHNSMALVAFVGDRCDVQRPSTSAQAEIERPDPAAGSQPAAHTQGTRGQPTHTQIGAPSQVRNTQPRFRFPTHRPRRHATLLRSFQQMEEDWIRDSAQFVNTTLNFHNMIRRQMAGARQTMAQVGAQQLEMNQTMQGMQQHMSQISQQLQQLPLIRQHLAEANQHRQELNGLLRSLLARMEADPQNHNSPPNTNNTQEQP